MSIDLIGCIELTASAAIVIAALSSGLGLNTAMRVRIAAWLSAWFVVVVILAATRALYYEHGLGAPGLGVAVALPIYTAHRLPAPFAPIAGWGDIFVGATAPLVALLAYRRGVMTRPILWIWNLIGALDLIAAVGLGVLSSPGLQHLILAEPSSAIMTTLPWLLIPGFLVPLLFAVHIGIFVRLKRPNAG